MSGRMVPRVTATIPWKDGTHTCNDLVTDSDAAKLERVVEAAKVMRDEAQDAIGIAQDGTLVAQYDGCGSPEGWPTVLQSAIRAFDAAIAELRKP